MANKPQSQQADSTGSSALAQFPPRISLASSVLSSAIELPQNPHVAYAIFTVHDDGAELSALDHANIIEQARRHIWQRNESYSVSDSLLTSVYVARDTAALYVFALGSADWFTGAEYALRALQLDGLNSTGVARFSPSNLYPCSEECSARITPCPACMDEADQSSGLNIDASQLSSSIFLPRIIWRRVYSQFLQALRERLIDDVAKASSLNHSGEEAVLRPVRPVVRLKDGFLLGYPPSSSGEWNSGWAHRTTHRTLMNCRLNIELQSKRILVQPVLRPTWYLPLSSVLPIPAGAPIELLPHGASAYYLSTYAGPSSGLTAQFQTSLLGLGVGDWMHQWSSALASSSTAAAAPSYAIVWVAAQHKQGEEKGVVAIWPISLCIAFSPGAPVAPPPLSAIPILPPQLQPSPQTAPTQASTSISKASLRAFTPTVTASSMPSPVTDPHTPHPSTSRRSTPNPHEARDETRPLAPLPARPFRAQRSSPCDSLYALKTLTLTNRDIGKVASEVSSYVDSVAKEREKERERLRRERESGSSRAASTGSSPAKPEERTATTEFAKALPVRSRSLKSAILSQEASPDVASGNTRQMHSSPDAMDQDSPQTVQPPPALLPAPEITTTPPPRQSSAEAAPSPPATSAAAVAGGPSATSSGDNNNQFETFGSYDNGWSQGPGEFINLGMDIDNFGVSLGDYSMGMDVDGDASGGFGDGDGFGQFTDDDFNFFDAPARSAAHPAAAHAANAAMPMHVSVMANAMNQAMHATGPGPPPVSAHAPWSHAIGEGFTPQSLNAGTPSVLPPPDLVPSTPTVSPPSHSVPVTPTVILADHPRPDHARKGSRSTIFDPIPFAEVHKLTDDKYAMGKFALPTPPDEEDRTHPIPRTSFRPSAGGWKANYTAVTDPRVGIINRLKRKRRKNELYSERRASPAWMTEYEEWVNSPYNAGSDGEVDDQRSDSDNDDDDDDSDFAEEEHEMYAPERTHTPPPPYLPPGPSLIPTHFFLPYLLSLSIPLRPPGANLGNVPGSVAGPMSVPTPVSPSAVLGDAAEKTHALEEATQVLVHELVENCVWESCWRSLMTSVHGTRKPPGDVWQVDVEYVRELLGSVESLQGPLPVKDVCRDAYTAVSFQELDSPSLAVGKSNTIIKVLPSALRFWEKLGLGPRAGPKDVSAFVIYEGSDDEKEQLLENWLGKVSQVYTARKFGKHTPGRAPGCVRDGLVPIHLETIRKTLTSFITGLPQPDTPAIFYIIVPAHIINLTNIALRRVLQAVKRAARTSTHGARVFHLVPEPFITGALDEPSMSYSGLEYMVSSVYDRLQVPARRIMSRVFSAESSQPLHAFFYEPAFTLVPRSLPSVRFDTEPSPSTLDVLDRDMLLHVGYLISSCGKWLFIAAIDQAGTTHDLRALLIPCEGVQSFVVSNVWDFAMRMALKANVEWHIAVARLGPMTSAEYDAWMSYTGSYIMAPSEIVSSRISLLVIESERMWHFVLPDHSETVKCSMSPNRSAKVTPGTTFHDISATTYLIRPSQPLMISVPSEIPSSSISQGLAESDHDEPDEKLAMRPFTSSVLLRVPAGSDFTAISTLRLHVMGTLWATNSATDNEEVLEAIARNYYDLSVLTCRRWNLRCNRILPFHLAALEVMQLALDRIEAATD